MAEPYTPDRSGRPRLLTRREDSPAGDAPCNEQNSTIERTEGTPAPQIADIVSEYYAGVYRYAFRLCGAECDALDLTQQTFLAAQQKLHQVRDRQRLAAWLFAVLRNCYLKSLRKARPLLAASLELAVDEIPDRPPASEEIDQEKLQRALDRLSDEFKLVVVMYYFEGSSYKEIADELQIPIGTVMSRLARAKGRLRRELLAAEGGSRRVDSPSKPK